MPVAAQQVRRAAHGVGTCREVRLERRVPITHLISPSRYRVRHASESEVGCIHVKGIGYQPGGRPGQTSVSTYRAKYLIAAAALAAATLLSGGITAAGVSQATCTDDWALTPSDPAPAVRGQSLAMAAATLQAAGYNCTVANVKTAGVDEQAVVVAAQQTRTESDPDGGISLVALSLGVVMPDLTGKTLRVAEETVTQLGLLVRTSPSDAAADWTVRQQRPGAGGYVVFGRAVTVILAEPVQPDLVPVPNLIEHTETNAAAMVKAAGLVYAQRILKDGKRPGRVVSQQPQPGELVDRGTKVTADIRRAPITTPTTTPTTTPPPVVVRTVVPDVVGRLESTAQQAIGAARLKFRSRVVRPGNAPGIVLNQSPRAGTEAEVGTVVTVDVTRAPKPKLVPVPDLLDRSEAEARGAIEDVELILEPIRGSDASGGERHVVSQQPRAGELVPTGTTVTVRLAADEWTWPSWLVPLLLVTAAVAVGAAGAFQHRRGPKPRIDPMPQVRAEGRLTPGASRIHESGPAHRIRVEARLDRGRQYLQEKTDEHQ
ncbi:PASTA domain-containing protein [Kribbella speibonae]|uniref:PASTA domain-containing protein n=1 Tax=Kribbella speibonae TaxID=1572660 RepID=A0ABY2ACN0_9ACTN|nr:PASTA domain-containing protein [Kribbella speibonae]